MSYKILLLVANFAFINALTSLSTSNCPSQFSIAQANTTTENVIFQYGSFLYSGFQSQSSKARIEAIIIGGNSKDLKKYQTQLMAPYIIFGVVFILFYLGTVLCCLFDRSCPPCESIRRNLDEEPYSIKEKRFATFFTLLFSLSIFIICIVAVSYVPKIKQYGQLSTCSIYVGIDTVVNGDQSWGGFIQLRNNVGNITNLLSAAVQSITTEFSDGDWLDESMKSMRNANLNIYSSYISSQLITPNPDTTRTAINAGQNVPRIDSLFIKQGMGPNGTANRMITDIDKGLQTTSKLSNKAYEIYRSANLLKQSKNTILSNSQLSQNTLLMYIRQLEVMTTQYNQIHQQYFDDYFTFAISLFQGIFAFVLTGSLIAILGVIATNIFDINICRGMVHLAWTIYGLSYVGVIAIAFIMLSMGSLGYGFCNYYSSMLKSVNIYNNLGNSYTQNAFKRLDTCIFGTGNALQKFSLANEMNTVQELFINIETYFDYTNTVSNNYVNLDISTSKINEWINAMEKYKLGIYTDSDPIITNNNNPNYALSQLNTFTYDVSTIPRDIWVWDKVNCTNPLQVTYTAQSTLGVTLSPNETLCISFNQKIINTAQNSWSISDIATRYLSIRQTTAARYQNIYDYASTLISFRDSRINLFQAIKDSLSSLYTQNVNFNTRMNTFKGTVTRFYSSVSTLNNLITNSINGLIKTSNCKSIGDKMRFTYNVFCVNFMSQIVKVGLCTCLLMVLMFGGMIAGSRFGMIYAQLEKKKIINMPDEINSEKDIKDMHINRTQESGSSNSNDDD